MLFLYAAFTLIYGLLIMASAPFSIIGSDYPPDDDPDSSISAPESNQPNTSSPPSSPPSPPAPIPTKDPSNSDYVLLRMRPSDVSRGSLILINHSHSFELLDNNDLVAISDFITPSYSLITPGAMLSSIVINPLNEMMDAFFEETGNSTVAIRSAYRSRAGQQQVFEHYVRLVGRAEAQRWASLPGYSEHQAGLAVDLGRSVNGETYAFTGTGIYSWFNENCHRFGFILRYPPDKTEITLIHYEPWHYRFVGNPHAYIIYTNNWSLEEYIEILFGYSRENPFKFTHNGIYYEIYFTVDMDIRLPFDSEFDVSGNNINGFIVTIMR